MNILVWKAYGETDVFSAESVVDIEKIIERLTDIFLHWKDHATEEELSLLIEKVKKYSIENQDSEIGLAKRLRNNILRFLQHRNLTCAYDVDEFEYFNFQEVQKID